jgi:hypothetical protein
MRAQVVGTNLFGLSAFSTDEIQIKNQNRSNHAAITT